MLVIVQEARAHVVDVVPELAAELPDAESVVLLREHARWVGTDSWRLINAADPRGT